MITIQNGKFIIPDNDRFVGFAGDNTVNTKQLVLLNRAEDNCTYTLCLRFDDDSVCSVPLTAEVDGADTVLTWEIHREQLYAAGIVTAQLKTVGSDGSTAHSTKDFFVIGSSVERDENGAEMEYVTPSQLGNSINQVLQKVSAIAPYIGEDGFWYVYDPEAGIYAKTAYHISGQEIDSAMSDSSTNSVGNKFIKQYVDDKAGNCNDFAKAYTDSETADKVKNTLTVAGFPLTSNITASALANAIKGYFVRVNVIPGRDSGTVGQMGIGANGEVYFCMAESRWTPLVTSTDLDEKMNLIVEEDAADIVYIEDGSLFLSDGTLYMKYDGKAVAIPTGNDVYTKAEIDSMLSEVKSLLGNV